MAVSVGSVVFAISADLKNLQGQLRTMEGNFQSSFGKIQGMAASFGKGIFAGIVGGLGVSAITSFTKDVIDLAGHLSDLAEQTGFTAQTLSGLKSTLEQNGTTVDAFAKAVNTMLRSLGSVDDEGDDAARAIKTLGLSLTELRNLSPEEAFRKIAQALVAVQNPFQRAELAARIFKKSWDEIGPAIKAVIPDFDRLAKSGMTKEQLESIDQLGDNLTKLADAVKVLAAAPIAKVADFLSLLAGTARPSLALDEAVKKVDALSKKLADIKGVSIGEINAKSIEDLKKLEQSIPEKGFLSRLLQPTGKPTTQELIKAREEMERLVGILAANEGAVKKPFEDRGKIKAFSDKTKQAKNDVENFLASLEKQLAGLETKKIELTLGPQAALAKELDDAFKQFKEKLTPEELSKLPKTLEADFKKLKTAILEANQELKQTEFQIQRTAEAARAFDQDMEEMGRAGEEAAKHIADELKPLEDKFKELQKSLTIERLPESQRQQATVMQEYAERIEMIQQWRDAAIRAGQDVEEVNRQAAEAVAGAWAASQQKLKDQADETSEFIRRAFERGFDAVSDTIKGVLDDGFKSFEDFGEKIRKTINSLVADFLTLQLKNLVLGPQYGQKGAPIGGWLGQILGTGQQGTGQRPPGVQGPMLPGGFYSAGGIFAPTQAPYQFPPGSTPPFNPESGGGVMGSAGGLFGGGNLFGNLFSSLMGKFQEQLGVGGFAGPNDPILAEFKNKQEALAAGWGRLDLLEEQLGVGGFAGADEPILAEFGSKAEAIAAGWGNAMQEQMPAIGDSLSEAMQAPLPSFFNLFMKGLQQVFGGLSAGGATSGGGGFFGALLGLFGMGGSSATGTLATAQGSLGVDPYAGMMAGGFIHRGGVAGYAVDRRMINPAVFYQAQRYHMGGMALRSDEVPAILQRGETVIPKGMNAGGAINININSPDVDGFRRNKGQILSDLTRAVRKGQKHL